MPSDQEEDLFVGLPEDNLVILSDIGRQL